MPDYDTRWEEGRDPREPYMVAVVSSVECVDLILDYIATCDDSEIEGLTAALRCILHNDGPRAEDVVAQARTMIE